MMTQQEFTMGAGGVPAGSYPSAEFIGTEDYENEYGKAVRLKWRILGGEQDGQEATRICSPNMSAKSALGKLAVALKGGPIAIGETFRFTDYVGVRGSLIVEQTQSGGGRVSMFLRQTAPQASPPPVAPPQASPPPPPQASPSAEEMAAFQAWQAKQQGTEQF